MSENQETLVRYETDEKVSIITLDRASKLNAINAAMKDQIVEAFSRADKDPATSVVVLRANGRSFSAGFDIGHSPDRGQEFGAADPNTWDSDPASQLRFRNGAVVGPKARDRLGARPRARRRLRAHADVRPDDRGRRRQVR